MRVLILAAAALSCSVKGESVQQEKSVRNQPVPHLYSVTINGKYGFIDEDGNLKFTLPDDVYTIRSFSEGLAVIARRVPDTYGRWGYVDHTGKFAIEAKFNLAKPFSEGLAAVFVGEEKGKAGSKFGYIDQTGRFIIQPQFERTGTMSDFPFSEGLAAVPSASPQTKSVLTRKWGYIDKTGKFVIEPRFDQAFPFSEGRAIVGMAKPSYAEPKYGVIDKQGQWIVEAQYESITQFSEGLAAIVVEDKVGFIDLQGKIVIKPQFRHGAQCPNMFGGERFSEGLAAVNRDVWEWGFIDRTGKWVIQPVYGCAQPFSEGLALIGVRDQLGSRWRYGFIDKTGATIIKPEFSEARPFVGKLAIVGVGMSEDEAMWKALQDHQAGKSKAEIEKELESNKARHGYIDCTGKFVWNPTN